MGALTRLTPAGILATSAIVIAIAIGGVAAAAAPQIKQHSDGLFFLRDTHVVIVDGRRDPSTHQCLDTTAQSCDVFFVQAPFVCKNCEGDFANAFADGGNLTIGLGPGGTCSGYPTSFDYVTGYNPDAFFLKQEKLDQGNQGGNSQGGGNATVYTLPAEFQGNNGQIFALVRMIFIGKDYGLLEATGNGQLPDIESSPASLYASLVVGGGKTIADGSCGDVPAVITTLKNPPADGINPQLP